MNAVKCLLTLMILAMHACADDTTSSAATRHHASGLASGLAVIGSDYKTTSVSLVDRATLKVVAQNFLHSGSNVTPGGTALGGDVVVAQTPAPDGRLVLIDRGSGVLTSIDPLTLQVTEQLSVATGFYANPQDYAEVAPGRAYVTRMGRNAKPTPDPSDFDEGDDVLVLDMLRHSLVGRIEVGSHATLAGTLGAPGRMAYDGSIIWVPLGSLGADFKSAGTGRILGLDAKTGAIVHSVDAPGSKNCVQAARLPGTHRIGVVCSGFFGEAGGAQAKFSQILVFDALDVPVQAAAVVKAADLEGKSPFGKDIAFVDATRGVVIASGDLAAGTADRLWLFDIATGTGSRLANGHGAFTLSGLHAEAARLRLWVGEAGRPGGDLRVFDLAGAAPYELEPVPSNPGGLGAMDLGGF